MLYDWQWRPYFSCRKLRWYERRARGITAPYGDLTYYWQYRLPQRSAVWTRS